MGLLIRKLDAMKNKWSGNAYCETEINGRLESATQILEQIKIYRREQCSEIEILRSLEKVSDQPPRGHKASEKNNRKKTNTKLRKKNHGILRASTREVIIAKPDKTRKNILGTLVTPPHTPSYGKARRPQTPSDQLTRDLEATSAYDSNTVDGDDTAAFQQGSKHICHGLPSGDRGYSPNENDDTEKDRSAGKVLAWSGVVGQSIPHEDNVNEDASTPTVEKLMASYNDEESETPDGRLYDSLCNDKNLSSIAKNKNRMTKTREIKKSLIRSTPVGNYIPTPNTSAPSKYQYAKSNRYHKVSRKHPTGTCQNANNTETSNRKPSQEEERITLTTTTYETAQISKPKRLAHMKHNLYQQKSFFRTRRY